MSEVVSAGSPAPAQNPGQSMPAPNRASGGGQSQAPSAPPPEVPPAAAAPQIYEIDGQKYTIDQIRELNKTAKGAAEIRRAAADKFRETADRQKKFEQWATQFEGDPFEATIQFFENKGVPRGQAEQMARQKFENAYKSRYIEPEMMTPEQREAAKWKSEAEKAKKERDDWEAQKKQESESVHKQAMVQAMQTQIIQTIEQHKLPKTAETVKKLAFFMNQNLKHGYDAPMEVVVQQVRDEEMGRTQHYADALEGEALINWLGPNIIKKVRQYDLSQLKGRLKVPEQASPAQKNNERKEPTRPSDVDKYFRELRMSKK